MAIKRASVVAERAYAPKLPDLMETAVAALGVKELMAHVSVRGGLLQAKGRANDLADVHAMVGAHRGQANRAGPGPWLHVRYAVSADLFDPIGLAD